ncbi:hypothetical protein IF1G_11387 [Cordyceps javanica]|uniref:Uncharacterized protein n=1 Tax=Cordyceps javanica TaxID=43265 RepID=A0A545UKF6_9HYPO|nr:hypothetical protein IF1G_11387 [Cordyceps javanica]
MMLLNAARCCGRTVLYTHDLQQRWTPRSRNTLSTSSSTTGSPCQAAPDGTMLQPDGTMLQWHEFDVSHGVCRSEN